MAAVAYRGVSLRTRRMRGRQENGDENVTLDYSKGPEEAMKEMLPMLVKQHGISKSRKLGYYNAFVRLCFRFGTCHHRGYTKTDVIACLRLGLLHEAKEMRAACLRSLRYFCQEKETVDVLLRLHVDYLIARSLDICLDNEVERVHALRLIRKLMLVYPEKFPVSLLNVLVSIANDGAHERDRMVRACLATLCELAFLNPRVVCRHGGVSAILRNVLDCHLLPRVNESLLTTVLCMLNHPRTRHYVKQDIDLEQMLAPFTDCHYRFRGDTNDSSGEEKENRFAACKMAVATIMKSWPGMIRLCRPDSSGLQSLLGALYLENMETRKEIMDILFDVFRLPIPEWTEDFSKALLSIDPSEMRDTWRLAEGFVAEEGKAVLPHLAKARPNLVDNHMALVLSSFISAGLLEAMVEVITTSNDHVSARATILLGELLHMANSILPLECGHHSHCLPSLISKAASFNKHTKAQALASRAVRCLDRLHAMKKRGPVPCSVFLDQIIQSSTEIKENSCRPLLSKDKLTQAFQKPDDDHEIVNQAIKDSQVLQTKENFDWDWDLIFAILEWPDESLKKLDEQTNQRFVRRLLYFYKPTNRLFATISLTHDECQKFVVSGLHFVDLLLDCAEASEEGVKYIDEFLGDIMKHIGEVSGQPPHTEGLLSASALTHTCGQHYFLFIGRFSRSHRGEKHLERCGIFQSLLELVSSSANDVYTKLIVSSLDYTRDGQTRILLRKALTSASEVAKLYCVNFIRVLLRAKAAFLSTWGMEMLVTQLYDPFKTVAMEALSVLSEACEDEANLHSLVKQRPSVLHLGHKGAMLLARFLSIPAGFKFLGEANYIKLELEKWHTTFNRKYVHLVEERLNEALTTYEKTYDGTYIRRSHRRRPRQDVYVPVHLYGQMVQHKQGFQILEQERYLDEFMESISEQVLHTDEDVLTLKAALWAVGHIGTSVWGLRLLQEQNIIPEIVKLAEECGVFSVRGTAYFVLGLLAGTKKGADLLNNYGWESVRHKHTEVWPTLEEAGVSSTGPDDLDYGGGISVGMGLGAGMVRVRGSPACASLQSVTSSTRSDGGQGSGTLLPAVTRSHLEAVGGGGGGGGASSSSCSSSPRPTFFIGLRSRSSTGPSPGLLSTSLDTSNPGGSVAGGVRDGVEQGGRGEPAMDSIDALASAHCTPGSDREVPVVVEVDPRDVSTGSNDASFLPTPRPTSPSGSVGKDRSVSAPEPHVTNHVPLTAEIAHFRSRSDPQEGAAAARGGGRAERRVPVCRSSSQMVHFEESGEDQKDSGHDSGWDLAAKADADNGCASSQQEAAGRARTGTSLSDTTGSARNDQLSVRDERSNSNGSSLSKATGALMPNNKLRSDSVQTDTSSGFSSMESSTHYPTTISEHAQLTPIPSASSIRTDASRQSQSQGSSEESISQTHPSDLHRRMANLKRMPMLRRRFSNPGMGHISPASTMERGGKKELSADPEMVGFTSNRDLLGYATLRELNQLHMSQRKEMEADTTLTSVFEEHQSFSAEAKSKSLDYRRQKSRNGFSKTKFIPRKRLTETLLCGCGLSKGANVSSASLEDLNASPGGGLPQVPSAGNLVSRNMSSTNLRRLKSSKRLAGRAEYIGICLPVDISMIFQVSEGEDERSCVQTEDSGAEEDAVTMTRKKALAFRKRLGQRSSQSGPDGDFVTGLEYHCEDTCLACSRFQHGDYSNQDKETDVDDAFYPDGVAGAVGAEAGSPQPSPLQGFPRTGKSRNSSLSDLAHGTSVTSITSVESAAKPRMSEESTEGRTLIRKEAIRLVVNLSSSVGAKSHEQGLLVLRQKFPSAFQDVCLYSEVSYLLSHYRYRLTSRRFIQELFQDVDFSKLYEVARSITGVTEEAAEDYVGATESDMRLERVLESMT